MANNTTNKSAKKDPAIKKRGKRKKSNIIILFSLFTNIY